MKTKKIIALLACLCLTTGCASAAFAETVPTAPSMTARAGDPAASRLSLSDLVAQEILTQETADAITAYLTENPITPPDGQPDEAANGQQPGGGSDAQQPGNAPSGENTQQPDGNGQQPNGAPGGQPGEAPNGQQPGGSSDAQQPGNSSDAQQPSGQPDGAPNGQPAEAPNGQPAEAPNGQQPDGGSDAQQPGNAPSGENTQQPDGNGQQPDGGSDAQQPGNSSDAQQPSGQPAEAPNGQQPDGGSDAQQPGNAPSGENTQQPDGNGQQPNGAPGGQPGEAPNGQQPGGSSDAQQPGGTPDGQPGFSADAVDRLALEVLLENEIITQDEYDAIAALLPEDSENGMPSGQQPGSAPGGQPGNGTPDGGAPGGAPGGMSGQPDSYDAARSLSEDAAISGETLESTGTDENALLVTGGTVSVDGATVTRASDDSTGGDASSFYGVGAAILVTGGTVSVDGATVTRASDDSAGDDASSFYGVGAAILATGGTLTVSNSEITTDANGGAGVFAYGDAVVTVSDATIATSKDTSGGVHVAGGGTLYASDLTVTTEGASSAAVRSDRGGGTLVVDGGSYTASGSGSPAVYVTADVTLSNAALTATGSEALCLEGLNSVLLTDCDLTGDMPDQDQNDTTWTVILYQSMSGDSEVGKGTFTMEGGSLTSLNGGLFYTTNTESEFSLRNVTLTADDDSEFLLRCTGNANRRDWGQTGANGADCTFTAAEQTMDGDVIWDSISNLGLNLTEGSVLTGAILDDESCAGEGGDGACALTIDAASKWIVTGDSVLTTLSCDGEIVDADGRAVTLAASDGTVLSEGTSACTVTILSGELA